LAELDLQRRWYADELRWNAGLKSERLVEAFATVPREAFLGRGPWRLLLSGTQAGLGYTRTNDADPRHLSHNVLVAIDPGRWLNNGHPSFLAWLIEQLELKDGQSVYHVGAGTGYYSAILATMVGKKGRVVAIEVDKTLARRARQNLRAYRQVEVVAGDGFSHSWGRILKAMRGTAGWSARFVEQVGIYPCVGSRTRHAENRSCWLHHPKYCLSRRP
jgi:protein-L-isoaspartate(D-aspartate) O-methyltransferase